MAQTPLHLDLDLTATQRKILEANPQRYYCLLVNSSDTDCRISLGSPAAANKGILLTANGGWFEINLSNPYTGRIYAVSGGATKRLNITEISS